MKVLDIVDYQGFPTLIKNASEYSTRGAIHFLLDDTLLNVIADK